MKANRATAVLLGVSLGLSPVMVGCENLPGTKGQQGAVIGGLGGAAAGAALGGKDNRLLGALLGGAVGAGGGYLVGANWDKINGNKSDDAREAERKAREHPVTAEDVRHSRTADVDDNGFVTMDEVVAMENAGLSDSEMIDRLDRTHQYFELTREQQQYLRDRGVSKRVVTAMNDMHPDNTRNASRRDEPPQRISSGND
jgi:hypothetical protein